MNKKLFVFFQHCLPLRFISVLVGYLATSRIPWIKNIFIRWYIKHYQVDMSLAEKEDIQAYSTFNDFFTRTLKTNVRPICTEENTLIYPVDGTVSQWGTIQHDKLIQAKNIDYSLSHLLTDEEISKQFQDGNFITLYLSPRDYHRIHMPVTGTLLKTIYVPGKLFSVNAASTELIPELFTKNERLICIFQTHYGLLSVILVGAMIVAGINTTWAGQANSLAHKGTLRVTSYENQAIQLIRGAELGSFSLGSTVILLMDASMKMHWNSDLYLEMPCRMGEKLATLTFT